MFDTRYGNTKRVAKALAKGIQKSAMEATCLNINDAQIDAIAGFDFLAIGGPTHFTTTSKPMENFLGSWNRRILGANTGSPSTLG